jgi:hypothetical protein
MIFRRDLSDRLGMSREEGERWIVDLVRDAKLDAKIDFKEVRCIPLLLRGSSHQNVN